MKEIAIYGFGGFGREVACLIHHLNQAQEKWKLIGFFDDGVDAGEECKYGKVLGNMETLNAWGYPLSIAIAIGSPKFLKEIPEKITNPFINFPNIIAPNTFFFDRESVTIGKGNIITFGCRLSCDITIGDFNILNGCVSLGHDVVLGSHNILLPETRISGQSQLGNSNYLGSKVFISQCLHIGNNTRIGAGSIVLRNTKDNCLYMGNPAKRMII